MLGARNYQVVTQLIIETLLFGITSLVLALMLLYLLFPQIQQLFDVDIKIKMLNDARVLGVLAFGLFFLVLISTYIPAHQFVTNKISLSLKSIGLSYKSSTGKALLFTQLAISIICICSTLMVSRQVDYIHNKQLGFEKSNLLVLSLPEDFTTQEMQVLKHRLKGTTGIVAVSNSSFRIGGGYWKDWYYVESGDEMMPIELYEVFSDDELFSTLDIKILSGRTFDAHILSDSGAAFVINETAARKLGWADPIGKRIYTVPEEKGKWDGTIVGVVADINISPLYEKIEPLVMRLPWQNNYPEYFLYVRFMGDPNRVIKSIEKEYNEVHKGYPLAYRFVDELYNSRHLKEMKVFNSLQIGSTFIIVISMLGIFSLASFISVRRMKEFGIRKILGASILQIIQLHMSYFIPIVIVSNLIALPITFWMISEWLNSFAYRVEVTYLPFLVVGFFIFLLVILSTGYSSWKAGNMNPVDVIKIQ